MLLTLRRSGRARSSAALVGLLASGAMASALVTVAPHAVAAGKRVAVPVTAYQLPFTCAQGWTAGSRASHSPSRYAMDFNRSKDLGKAVVAAAPGRVTVASDSTRGGYGRYVVIDHGNGESSLYAHLKNVMVVPGATVDQGALIGAVGSTGNSSGAHLHFEQRVGRDVVPVHLGRVAFGGGAVTSANCVDVPLAADLEGGGADELAVFSRSSKGEFLVHQPNGAPPRSMRFGSGTDEPLLADWNGDGVADPGVWNPRGRRFKLSVDGGVVSFRYGSRGDRPVAGDWDGDGRAEVGVFRPTAATFYLRSAAGATSTVRLGDADDVPVAGDWNGDGRTDVGTYDRTLATFTLHHVDAAGVGVVSSVPFGLPGDLPTPGDWDGNGTTDPGTWTPATATFNLGQPPAAGTAARTLATVQFGRPR